jgi:xanthine/uracil permease
MYAFGLTLAIVGGLVFASGVMYYVVDHMRTGILYRAHKRALFPVILGGWVVAVVGGVLLGIANGELDGGERRMETESPETPAWFFPVFLPLCAASVVFFWVLDYRRKNRRLGNDKTLPRDIPHESGQAVDDGGEHVTD